MMVTAVETISPGRNARRLSRASGLLLCLVCAAATVPLQAQESQWVRPAKPSDALTWGRRDGVVFGLASEGGMKGPRGLIRVGVIPDGTAIAQRLNYIAVEPVVKGPGERFDRMAFSELEKSELDPGLRGKRMWVHSNAADEKDAYRGKLESIRVGDETIERLSVRIDVEKFTANGAHVYLVAAIDSNKPGELRLSVFAEDDSPPIEEMTVTATMGNYERLRLLWLKDRVEASGKLFGDYDGQDFAEKGSYPLPEMLRSGEGDAIVFCTSNEDAPQKTAGNDSAHWVYTLPKLTQYWRVPGSDVEPNLRVRVNARRVYWASTAPVLGGIAFENFEVRERFVPGQTFVYGITRQEPWDFYKGLSRLAVRPADRTAGAEKKLY